MIAAHFNFPPGVRAAHAESFQPALRICIDGLREILAQDWSRG